MLDTKAENAAKLRRILFFAESVTLAHVTRPFALARALAAEEFSVTFATSPRYKNLLVGFEGEFRNLHSIDSEAFLNAAANGRPFYSLQTLREYVRDDLQVIDAAEPDVIVGDFRLSLSISARLARVPYVSLINAHWSPSASPRFEIPCLPVTRMMNLTIAQTAFRIIRPFAFAYHSLPLNRLRHEHGLRALGFDLREVYSDGDVTLYLDVPELIPTRELPPNHHYIGPVQWSPPIPLPPWWNELPREMPLIYVTMGSSGSHRLLPALVDTLSDLPCTIVAATAGAPIERKWPRKVYVADYLPGDEIVKRTSLVICNGGSAQSYQALAAGVPVLGLPSNMDQFLTMSYIAMAGAGATIRADRATPDSVKERAQRMLADPAYGYRAQEIARAFARYKPADGLRKVLLDVRPEISIPRERRTAAT